MANPYEAAARVRKAMALASHLRGIGGTAFTVAHLDDEGWSLAAQGAGTGVPSDATKASVVAILKAREEEASSTVSPLAGL